MSYRHCIYFIPCSGLQDVKFHLYGAVLLCRTSYHTFCDPFFESPYSPAPGTTWTLYSGINWKSSCTWRKQHGICLSFFGGEFLASWCTSDEAHRDNNSYLFLVLKNRKEFFSKREKRKENGTFGINFADLLLGHKQEKKYSAFTSQPIRIYLTNYIS